MAKLNRLQMAWRAAQDLQEGMVVNLGSKGHGRTARPLLPVVEEMR